MIAWKCWRENRQFVIAGLVWLLVFWVVLLSHGQTVESGPRFVQSGPDLLSRVMQEFLNLQIIVFALLAWGMGTRGVGRDVGNGAGSFVLTRPVRRGSLVWTEWSIGVALLVGLLICGGFCYWAAVHFHVLRITYMRLGPAYQRVWEDAAVSPGTVAVASLAAFVFLALIFSLTHCGTIMFRHSTRGLIFCLATLLGYLFLGWEIYLHHISWSPYFPDLLFQPFIDFPRNVHLVPHAVNSFVERAAILPLFPLIAQLFLRRAEV
jgi:hypothetical protein